MAQSNLPPIDYTSKDYEAFRNDLINLIPRKLPQWTDYSSSDPGITLLEMFAYIGDILSYYQDRQANEVYLPTLTQRKSIIDLVALVGYKLTPAIPSSTQVVFEIEKQAFDFVIPKGFSISTEQSEYEEAIVFETDTDLIIPANNTGLEQDESGEYLYKVRATQGITIRDEIVGSSNNTPNQRFALKYPSVINSPSLGMGTIEIYVNEGAGFELWTNLTDSTEIVRTETGKQYVTQTDENDITWIIFQDGVNGKIPAVGIDNIRANYRVGGGSTTDVGTGKITVLQSSMAGVKSVLNITAATGGVDRESVEEAKVSAPQFLQTSFRAVRPKDFESIAKSVPGVAKAKALLDPVIKNRVNVTISPVGGGLPTDELRETVFNLLDDVKIILTSIEIRDPVYQYLNL